MSKNKQKQAQKTQKTEKTPTKCFRHGAENCIFSDNLIGKEVTEMKGKKKMPNLLRQNR